MSIDWRHYSCTAWPQNKRFIISFPPVLHLKQSCLGIISFPIMPSSTVVWAVLYYFRVGNRSKMNFSLSIYDNSLVVNSLKGWKSCFLVFLTRAGMAFHGSLANVLVKNRSWSGCWFPSKHILHNYVPGHMRHLKIVPLIFFRPQPLQHVPLWVENRFYQR